MLLLFPMLPLTGWAEDETTDADDERPDAAGAAPGRPHLELLHPDTEAEADPDREPAALRKTA